MEVRTGALPCASFFDFDLIPLTTATLEITAGANLASERPPPPAFQLTTIDDIFVNNYHNSHPPWSDRTLTHLGQVTLPLTAHPLHTKLDYLNALLHSLETHLKRVEMDWVEF